MASRAEQAVDINHLRELSKKRLPKALFNALDHGSEDDVAFRHNREALERIKLVHRILRDVSRRDPSIELFGKKHGLPLIIGPTGIPSWVSYRGEISLARAAAKANIPFALTSTTSTPMERTLAEGGGTQWYQPYVWRDREATLRGIMRAAEAGFEALIITADSTVPYNRPYDERKKLQFPVNLRPENLLESVRHPRWTFTTPVRYLLDEKRLPASVNVAVPEGLSPAEKKAFFSKDDSLTWDFVRRLRDMWPRTLIVKGVLHPDDAVQAIECGVDGIVVSNHGGGTNDAAPAPVEMLPGIAAAVAGRIPVLVDSGFRRGSDVIKALALGADAVLLGRAPLYGLGAGGEAGASRAVALLGNEIQRMMGVLGVNDLSEIGRDHLLLPGDLDHLARNTVPWKGPHPDLVANPDLEYEAKP